MGNVASTGGLGSANHLFGDRAGPSCRASHRGHRLPLSACRGMLEKGRDESLIEALQADPHAIYQSCFRPCETIVQEAAKAGSVELIQVLTTSIKNNWEGLLRCGAVRLDSSTAPSAEAVLAAVVNARTGKGKTALILACLHGQAAVIPLLLSMGADMWAADRCGSKCALHYAALGGHSNCISALFDNMSPSQMRAADGSYYANVRTISGVTPLHCAVARSCPQAVKLLAGCYSADTCVLTKSECYDLALSVTPWSSPLHIAAHTGSVPTALALLKLFAERRGSSLQLADPRLMRDRTGHMPYQVALARKHKSLAELLHPGLDVTSLFSPEELQPVGPPPLQHLAAAAAKAMLLAQLEGAEGPTTEAREGSEVVVVADSCCSDPTSAPLSSSCACISDEDEEDCCGVCLDAEADVAMRACGHRVCTACAKQLCRAMHLKPAACPFCRRAVRGWVAVDH